ncbi:hypothetical protein HYC85_004651 [Camellia sinensis]|uniref:Alpha-N-acetylglucosaminidase tim-barrel domain-containing protein n=1 Tax=Camellia sinensis TaxID=4442 RepID=A0A7J7HZ30_CAMSI|nr:hypothetical protein HYC85_004651 [Camellia sinensis]
MNLMISTNFLSWERCGGELCFIINNHPSVGEHGAPEILISGVTGVELSCWSALHWCGAHISWDKTGGAQLSSVPKSGSLPHVQGDEVLVQRPIPWNYYQNAVTSSYTFTWWDWGRWEKEIDWMALQGINLPLAFTGQEAIWQKVFQTFNISSSDLNDFFGGPAFLAWSRMGNLHGLLHASTIFQMQMGRTSTSKLVRSTTNFTEENSCQNEKRRNNKKISFHYPLAKLILPAFSGNVPAALQSKFPSARITRLGNWCSGGDSGLGEVE